MCEKDDEDDHKDIDNDLLREAYKIQRSGALCPSITQASPD